MQSICRDLGPEYVAPCLIHSVTQVLSGGVTGKFKGLELQGATMLVTGYPSLTSMAVPWLTT